MNKIAVICLDSKNCSQKKKIEIIAQKFARLLKKDNCFLEIFLISSQKMKFLNKKFRNKDKTTNILTFVEPKNFPHPESKIKYLGEIYLNLNRISENELSLMVAHGLLHLFDFQHHKESDRIKMEAKENFLISHV